MSTYKIVAPNGRSVQIRSKQGRFEFNNGQILDSFEFPHVTTFARVFPTIFVEIIEAGKEPVVLEVPDEAFVAEEKQSTFQPPADEPPPPPKRGRGRPRKTK